VAAVELLLLDGGCRQKCQQLVNVYSSFLKVVLPIPKPPTKEMMAIMIL
jgi:hypothetical protein